MARSGASSDATNSSGTPMSRSGCSSGSFGVGIRYVVVVPPSEFTAVEMFVAGTADRSSPPAITSYPP